MTTAAVVARVEKNFSLGWIKENNDLFADRFIEFSREYPSNEWNHRIDLSVPGHVSFIADRKPAERSIFGPVGVKWEIITNAIIGAIEGGSGYWCVEYAYGHTPAFDNPDKHPAYACEDFWVKGGIVNFKYENYEDGPEIGVKHLSCNTLAWGLGIMADKYPNHFGDLLSENDDADTHDVLLQCALFGETIFG